MTEMIDQLVGGSEQHFRSCVQHGIERALSKIGLDVDACVVLGILSTDSDPSHRIYAEPVESSLFIHNFSVASHLSEERTDSKLERNISDSYVRLRGERASTHFSRSRAGDLVTAIEEQYEFEGCTFFSSRFAPIGDYEMRTCVGLPTIDLEPFPQVDLSIAEWGFVVPSLQDAVIDECLIRADRAIWLPRPGEDLRPVGATEDIVQAAVVRLIDELVGRTTEMPVDLFYALNALTSLSYEGARAGGRVAIVNPSRMDVVPKVRFERQVSVHDARIMRKLLELSDDNIAILCYDQGYSLCAYGLGACHPAPDIVEIRVLGHAQWGASEISGE